MASLKLFPPVIKSYTNGFKKNETLRVFFETSSFNTISEVSEVHVIVSRQDNNRSALNKTKYPNEIMRKSFFIENDKIWVEIYPEDISSWEEGKLYKIQLRLSEKAYSPETTGEASWLNDTTYFSEWSTVSLTKCVGDIQLRVPLLEKKENEDLVLYLSSLDFEAEYDSKNDTSEFLNQIQVNLYDSEHIFLESSGLIFSTLNNVFRYSFKQKLLNGQKYYVEVEGETNNYYNFSRSFSFTSQEISLDELKCNIYCSEEDRGDDEEEGCLTVRVESILPSLFSGNVELRRSSSKTNFSIWETVMINVIRNEVINFQFKDFTIESGIFYKYCIRKVDLSIEQGQRVVVQGGYTYMEKPQYRMFNYAYILGENNTQLKLSLNHQLSGFSRRVGENQQETLGGKFPVFTRNSNMKYNTFQIDGTISFEQDENKMFIKDEELFGGKDILDLYNSIIYSDGRLRRYDFTKERFFRNKVIDFLQSFKPRVYKSGSEGNLLVRISDVSLNPKNELNQLIYDFSATITECEEFNYENIIKYSFIVLNELASDFSIEKMIVGQLNETVKANYDLVSLINKKYQYEDNSILGYSYKIKRIFGAKILFNSPPYVYEDTKGDKKVGYKLLINGNIICLDSMGRYHVDSSIPLKSIVVLPRCDGGNTEADITIDFIIQREQVLNKGKTIKSRSVKKNIGQLFGSFTNGKMYHILLNKYSYERAKTYQRLASIDSLTIFGDPNLAVMIQDSKESAPEIHILGITETLSLYADEKTGVQISNFGIYGTYIGEESAFKKSAAKNFTLAKMRENTIYRKEDKTYLRSSEGELKEIVINNSRIYDITTPVDAIIEYTYSIERGTYY